MKNRITKKKSVCSCCGAKGFDYSEPFQDYGKLHLYDDGGDGKTFWRSSCNHPTKEKQTFHKTWSEYECECSCEC